MMDKDSWQVKWPADDPPEVPRWIWIVQWVWRAVVSSFYMVVVSLPIVTMPTAMAGLFGIARKTQQGDRGDVRRAFWHLFRSNFKQATIVGWPLFVLGAALVIDLHSMRTSGTVTLGLWVIGLLYLVWLTHLFSLMVHVDMDGGRLLIDSFKLIFYKIHWTALNVVLLVALWMVCVYSPLLLLFVFPGISASLSYWCFSRKIRGISVVPGNPGATSS